MSHFVKSAANSSRKTDHRTTHNDLILEDSTEDTETLPGSGSANILASGDKCQPIGWKEEQKRMKNEPKIQKQEVPNKFHIPEQREQREGSDAKIEEVSGDEFKYKVSSKNLENEADGFNELSLKQAPANVLVRQICRDSTLPPIFTATKIRAPAPEPCRSNADEIVSALPDLNQENQKAMIDVHEGDRNLLEGKKSVFSEERKSVDEDRPKSNHLMKLDLTKKEICDDKKIHKTIYNNVDGVSEVMCKETDSKGISLGLAPETKSLHEDSSGENEYVQIQEPQTVRNFDPVPLELEAAKDLKNLMLGSSSLMYSDEWRFQGFSFSDCEKLQYGIIQKKIGPCGIFSVVQSFLLKKLLFTSNSKSLNRSLELSFHEKTLALASALAEIFWQAGNHRKAVVTTLRKTAHLDPVGIHFDGITEKVLVVSFDNYDDLLNYLMLNIDQFKSVSGPGLILSVYSTILSRTTKKVYEDMDDSDNKLISDHGSCSQELINLFLMGHAISNVFNNYAETKGGYDEPKICKGVPFRSDIGFLTLSECCHKSTEVGTFLKTPRFPIWLLKIENQFCVLFSTKKDILLDWKAEKKFDLHFYSTSINQEKEIKLTIDNTDPSFRPPSQDETFSFVELGIRTKWSQADIHWPGGEPPVQWNRIQDTDSD